jgi:hypothetical protein
LGTVGHPPNAADIVLPAHFFERIVSGETTAECRDASRIGQVSAELDAQKAQLLGAGAILRRGGTACRKNHRDRGNQQPDRQPNVLWCGGGFARPKDIHAGSPSLVSRKGN